MPLRRRATRPPRIRPLHGRADVLRGGRRRRGAGGSQLGHQRGDGDARQRPDAVRRRHGHQGRRRPRRAGAGARAAGRARRPLRARAGLPLAGHAHPARRSASRWFRPRRCPATRRPIWTWRCICGRSSAACILSAQSSDAQQRAYGWKWAPTLSAFANAHLGNYVGFTGEQLLLVGRRGSSTGRCSTAAPGTRSATWRPRRRRRPRRRPRSSRTRSATISPTTRSLLDTRRAGGQGRRAGRRPGGGDPRSGRCSTRRGPSPRSISLAAQDNLVIAQESLASAASRGHRRSGAAPYGGHLPPR